MYQKKRTMSRSGALGFTSNERSAVPRPSIPSSTVLEIEEAAIASRLSCVTMRCSRSTLLCCTVSTVLIAAAISMGVWYAVIETA